MTSLRNGTPRELQLLQSPALTWLPGPSPPAHLLREGTHPLPLTLPSWFLDSSSSASTGISLQPHSAPSEQTLHTVNKRWAR